MSDQTPPDSWPTPEDETVVRRDETLVGGTPPPVAPPPDGPPPADRRIGAGMLLGLGVLVLVAAGILVGYLLTHKNDDKQSTTVVVTTAPTATASAKVAVPSFVGLKEEEALVRAGQLGLQPKEVFKPSKAPTGTVTSQNPPAGTELVRGAIVTLVIDAKAAAKPTTTQSTPTTTAQQTTAQQTTTAPTTTAPTTTAAATTPAQPTTATVPDVTGQKEPAAVTALGNAGILASIVFVPASDPLGTVVQQAKPSGTKVPFHSHMQINVSRGKVTTDATVPDAVGQTLEQAVGTINQAHLRLIYLKYPVTSRAQAGKVVQQSPVGGAKAPENAQIVVYLGAFKA